MGGLGYSWGGAWRLWAASEVPLRSLGHLPDVAGRLQDAPGPPKKHFRWLQGPPGRSLGRFPRTFFCRKCVRCLKPCPQPDATCACRRGCITSDEASSCSIQATHSPLTQSKTKQLQLHHQAAAAKRLMQQSKDELPASAAKRLRRQVDPSISVLREASDRRGGGEGV